MGGFFGIAARENCVHDVFFGVDYHSHLGTKRAGMAAYNEEDGFQRDIHNISNSPFRTKFERVCEEMHGHLSIGCISDADPQPLLVRSGLGDFAICIVGLIRNADELVQSLLDSGINHFEAMGGGHINTTELVASLISTKPSFAEGIRYVQKCVQGSLSVLVMTPDRLIAARDLHGRLPVVIGQGKKGCAVSFESFAYQKLDYQTVYELGPGEVVEIRPDGLTQLLPPGKSMHICAFLWTYYGYPNSAYEGKTVELMRMKDGELLAEADKKAGLAQDVDAVGGMPDSGTAYGIGYANASGKPFTRPFIKYTPTWPRSFMPSVQSLRNEVAKMKIIPVPELIQDKKLLMVDDSIVRGTQLKETVDFLYANGAREVHIRSACPPCLYTCKYLNFTSSKSEQELLARRTIMQLEGEEGFRHMDEYLDADTERGQAMRKEICRQMGFASLEFQSVEGLIQSIGLPEDRVCTYCWTGKDVEEEGESET